ncbi:ATP-dependent DNA helicase Q-like 2 [Lycium barbarum]|uniref:ATP-dependent DNA helicase Q-like 2 n=1 Tax=Lycium barbarum TaxID=112863 RepID=UPI00293F5897|nr:ATP-dependent DNA helicase Q-like 2 [Lycium barbarum]
MGRTEELLEELLNVEVELQDVQDQIKFLLDRQEKLHERQFELKALVESCESSSGPGADNAAVSVDDWSRPFEWDSQADDIRFNVLGISNYRANQQEPNVDIKELDELNVLVWWKKYKASHPILSRMARDILTVQVSTVALESAFSQGRQQIGDYRHSFRL